VVKSTAIWQVFMYCLCMCTGWGNIAVLVTRLQFGWPSNHGLIAGRDKRVFCTPKHPDWPRGSPSLLFGENQELFFWR
jgi:hypothetical protein